MSKRIAISCPDHIHSLLASMSEIQHRPMSRIVVELLEHAYPALKVVNDALVVANAERIKADNVGNDALKGTFFELKHEFASLVDEIEEHFSGGQKRDAPERVITGATNLQVIDFKGIGKNAK